MNEIKKYDGRIPACGVFCGGCPMYTRAKNPCPGAEINCQRCAGCKTFHLCCQDKNISYCYECDDFPCQKFKAFSKSWLKYGQDFIANQKVLKVDGLAKFVQYYNAKAK